MLVDRGSEVSLMSKSVFEGIKGKPVFHTCLRPLFADNSKPITVHGQAMLPIQFGEAVLTCQCLVADIKEPAIMGVDTMEACSCAIDMSTAILTIKGRHTVPLRQRPCIRTKDVISLVDFSIPPRSEALIACRISQSMNKQTLLIDAPRDTGILQPYMVARSVVSPQSREAMVQLLNLSPCPVEVREGDIVAQCETMK